MLHAPVLSESISLFGNYFFVITMTTQTVRIVSLTPANDKRR